MKKYDPSIIHTYPHITYVNLYYTIDVVGKMGNARDGANVSPAADLIV